MEEPQETRVQSLGQEDPLEKEMATPSSTLARRIQWREEKEKQKRKSTECHWKCAQYQLITLKMTVIGGEVNSTPYLYARNCISF